MYLANDRQPAIDQPKRFALVAELVTHHDAVYGCVPTADRFHLGLS